MEIAPQQAHRFVTCPLNWTALTGGELDYFYGLFCVNLSIAFESKQSQVLKSFQESVIWPASDRQLIGFSTKIVVYQSLSFTRACRLLEPFIRILPFIRDCCLPQFTFQSRVKRMVARMDHSSRDVLGEFNRIA